MSRPVKFLPSSYREFRFVPPGKIWRWSLGGLLCLMTMAAIYKTTERAHFEERLQRALWELRQSDDEPLALQTEARLKLLRQLRAPVAEKRWDAAKVLAFWKDRAAVPDLIAAMQDDKGTKRVCEIAHALGQIGDPVAAPALAQAISHPRNVDLRVCATQALAEIGDEGALAPLLEKARSSNPPGDGYEITILAIGCIGSPQALSDLWAIVEQNADARIRKLAESAIAQIELLQGEEVASKLLAALDDDSDWIQDSWIFKQLGDRWDNGVSLALNDYLTSGKVISTANLIQAAALLIHHQGMMSSTIAALAQSPQQQKRRLAQMGQAVKSVKSPREAP